MKQKLLNLLWILLLIGSSSYAQNRTVTGLVTSSDDRQPIVGVSVAVKGSKIGTQTGVDGRYAIPVPSESNTLVFSFIGFATQEVSVKSVVNISLVPKQNNLNEVVVVGYGTQLKKDVTGSQSSVKGSDFTDRAIPSFDKDLAGKATGVQVTNPSGLLGQPAQIRIRGTNSITNGASPLFVIDGVPVPPSNTGWVHQFKPVGGHKSK